MKFQKGKSGNPGGRPKEVAEVKELAREYTAEAIANLAKWMRSDNAKASVAAAQSLLDRGHGRAAQYLEITKKNAFDDLTAEQLASLATSLERGLLGAFAKDKDGAKQKKVRDVSPVH